MNTYVLWSIFFSSALTSTMHPSFFAYDRAVYSAQHNGWDDTKKKLTQLVVDAPDSPNLLYDTGVASYQTKDFDHALAYFKRAYSVEHASNLLKEQAHFNAGNSCVALQQLEQAVEEYEQTLRLNPENERAQHNLKKVKELLEKQKQEEEQEKQNQQEKEKKNEEQKEGQQQQDQPGEKQNEQSSSGQKDTNKSEKSGDKDKNMSDQEQGEDSDQRDEKSEKDESSDSQQSDDGQQSEQSSEHNDANKDDASSDSKGDKQEDTQKSNEQQDSDDQLDSGGQEQAPQNKEPKEHKDKDSTQSGAQENQEQEKETEKEDQQCGGLTDQAAQERADRQPQIDSWLAHLLDEHDKHDAQLQKQMIKATVNKELAGKNGENCW